VAPGGDGDGDEGVRSQRFVVCHNPAQAERDAAVRANLVTHLQQLIDGSDGWSARRRDEFVGSLKTKPGLRRYLRRTGAGLLRIDAGAIQAEAHLDGKWLLRTDDLTLTGEDLAAAYKQLTAVERGWRDMKGALALRPVFHHREDRIRGHVQLCWLALLLIRVAETSTGQTWRTLHQELIGCTWSPWPPATARSPSARCSPRGRRPSSPRWDCPSRPASSTSPLPAPDPSPQVRGVCSNTTPTAPARVRAGQVVVSRDRVPIRCGTPVSPAVTPPAGRDVGRLGAPAHQQSRRIVHLNRIGQPRRLLILSRLAGQDRRRRREINDLTRAMSPTEGSPLDCVAPHFNGAA